MAYGPKGCLGDAVNLVAAMTHFERESGDSSDESGSSVSSSPHGIARTRSSRRTRHRTRDDAELSPPASPTPTPRTMNLNIWRRNSGEDRPPEVWGFF